MRTWISKLARRFVSQSSVATPAATPAPTPVEGLETRQLMSASMTHGIVANTINASTYPKIVNMLHDTGTKTVRLWLTVNNWNSRSEDGLAKYVRRFHDAGFDTTVTVDPPHSGSYDEIKDCFAWLADDLGSAVDRWQVGNEVDREYGTLGTYVNDILAPAAAGIHSQGEKVVSGSVSWNPDDIKEMVDAGMLRYVDFVAYHPYRNTVAQLKDAVAEVKSVIGNKPLIATEWNVRGDNGDNDAWNDDIKAFWPTIRDNFYAAYYYAAVKVNTLAGPAGVMTSSGAPNGEFYSTFKGLGGGGGDGSLPTGGDDDGGQGNQAASNPTSKPAVGSFNIYDAITGQVLKGYTNVTGTLTIKLSSLAHRQIQIRALTSSNASSVKFGFTGRATRTENNAPYTAFGDSHGTAAPWTATTGTYTLTATAYTKDNATGTASTTQSLVLKFV